MNNLPLDNYAEYVEKYFSYNRENIKTKYFKYCPEQDIEDMKQNILLWLVKNHEKIREKEEGQWKTYLKMAIKHRLCNWVRDNVLRVKHLSYFKPDCDFYSDNLEYTDISNYINSRSKHTKKYLNTLSCAKIKDKKLSYSQILKIVSKDKKDITNFITNKDYDFIYE